MRIVGCFLEYEGKFVILFRRSHKPDGDTWGLPGGKVEVGETDGIAILRELKEETGYKAAPSELEHLGDFSFISSSNQPSIYVTYRVKLMTMHDISLEETAHSDFKWVTAEECYAETDLILGFHELLKLIGYVK